MLDITITDMERDLRRSQIVGLTVGAFAGGALGTLCGPGAWVCIGAGAAAGAAAGYLIGDVLGNGPLVRDTRNMKNEIAYMMGRAESLDVNQATIKVWQRGDGKVDIDTWVGNEHTSMTISNDAWSVFLKAHERYQSLPTQ